MSEQYVVIYERELEATAKVSKKASEDARMRKLERWAREAGITLPLDEQGTNFVQLVKNVASEYGLELGEKKWDIKKESNMIITEFEWALNRGGSKVGAARAKFELSLTPKSETENDITYPVKAKFWIELASSIVMEKATAGVPEMAGF